MDYEPQKRIAQKLDVGLEVSCDQNGGFPHDSILAEVFAYSVKAFPFMVFMASPCAFSDTVQTIRIEGQSVVLPLGMVATIAVGLIRYGYKKRKEELAIKAKLIDAQRNLEEFKAKNASDLLNELRDTVRLHGINLSHLGSQMENLIPRLTSVEAVTGRLIPLLEKLIKTWTEVIQLGPEAQLFRTKKAGNGEKP
jgi:hypothetical protein